MSSLVDADWRVNEEDSRGKEDPQIESKVWSMYPALETDTLPLGHGGG